MAQNRFILHKVKFSRNRNRKMVPSFLSLKDEIEYERQFYSEELKQSDWKYLKEAAELILIHAYNHLFYETDGLEIHGDDRDKTRYIQFYLNLAIGLELLLKSILLKKDKKINKPLDKLSFELDPERTISFSKIINEHLKEIFPRLSETTIDEVRNTLRLINLKRNNIAHLSKRSLDHYAYEYRFSFITLYIYEQFFYELNPELTELLLKSINRSKVQQGSDFKTLRIKPRSLRK